MSIPSSSASTSTSTSSVPRSPLAQKHHPSPRRALPSPSPSSGAGSASAGAASSSSTNGHSHPGASSTIAHDVSAYLASSFLPEVAPSAEEYEAKERARAGLQLLVERLWPSARLLPFGSMANGFALKNSDMDLCCLLGDKTPATPPSQCVELLGRLIASETNYVVKTLPRARIPIIKLTLPATPGAPWLGVLSCDIGFENRLALENTRLLGTYAKIDPRVRAMVLFLKVWTKRRQINNPYRGTLSSYGYVLLVIHFLAQIRQPPVLPNLQRLSPLRPHSLESLEYNGHDISFFSDLDSLPLVWRTQNTDSVGELLIEFFRYYSKDFNYSLSAISIRSEVGILSKESKGWNTDHFDYDPDVVVRDLHKLCIEDPFQLDYNVARTVTKDGLYTIRGEFMRAHRTLTARTHDRSPDRIPNLIAELCAQREDSLVIHPPTDGRPSPRRQSAPSPRLKSNPALASVPTTNPSPMSMAEFRLWAALNVTSVPTGTQRGFTSKPHLSAADTNTSLSGATASSATAYLEDAWGPPAGHPYGSPYQGGLPPRGVSQQRAQAPYARSQPASTPRGPPTLERRVSWDGSGPGSASSASASYDLHRFFQNQPGDPRSALTAPSSPDLGAGTSSSHYLNTFVGEDRRYRYDGNGDRWASAGPSPSNVGPRLATSVPARGPRFPHGSALVDDDGPLLPPPSILTFGTFPTPYAYHPSSSAASSSSYAASPARSFSTVGLLEEEADEELFSANGRGRSGSLPPLGASEGASRPRGRSVPHVRVDSDGRESILFGEVQTVLPKPQEDVPVVDDSTPHRSGEPNVGAETLPTFTTQPPTPVKSREAVPSLTSSHLETNAADGSDDGEDIPGCLVERLSPE